MGDVLNLRFMSAKGLPVGVNGVFKALFRGGRDKSCSSFTCYSRRLIGRLCPRARVCVVAVRGLVLSSWVNLFFIIFVDRVL